MAIAEKNTAYRALDVANFLVYLMSDSYDDLSNMKLNKILYYAQGHYLQKYGKPLFSDRILAFQHGPLIKSVYEKYKPYYDRPISDYDISETDVIEPDDKNFLLDIARRYGRYTAATLRNMTHRPKSPWSMVDEHEEIPIDSIRLYFVNNLTEISELEMNYSEEDFIGRRDDNGILVLPEDWQDAAV